MNTWQFTPFAICYVLAVFVSFFLSYLGWKMRPVRGATHFSLLTLSAGVWSLGYLLGFFNTALAWKLVMLRVEYIGIICTNYFWILFIIVYVYYDHWLTKRVLLLLGIIPILTFIQILTVEHHHLFYKTHDLAMKKGLMIFTKEYGPGFYLWTAYNYILFPVGGLILIWGILRMPSQLRRQTIPILMVLVLSLFFNFMYISGYNPISPYDPTPISFVIAGILYVMIMRRYKFLNIVPVAYNKVFEDVNTGAVIIDGRNVILDMNPVAEKILARKQQDALGRAVLDIFPEYDEFAGRSSSGQDIKTEIRLGDEQHIYELQTTPLTTQTGKIAGRIIMLFDITRRKWMENEQTRLIEKLQEKNVQLSEALEEIQSLKGIIPICASCKKIRDDKGYWEKVDVYIEKHSDASFSHGMCPDCLEENYGKEEWYIKMKKRKNSSTP